MPRIKAILFDLDDTLFDCCGLLVEVARRRAARAMVAAGLPCTEEEAYEEQIRLGEQHGPRYNVFDAMAERYAMPPSLAEAAMAAYNSDEVADIEPFPDVVDTLAACAGLQAAAVHDRGAGSSAAEDRAAGDRAVLRRDRHRGQRDG